MLLQLIIRVLSSGAKNKFGRFIGRNGRPTLLLFMNDLKKFDIILCGGPEKHKMGEI